MRWLNGITDSMDMSLSTFWAQEVMQASLLQGTTRRGTATPVHRPQRPAGRSQVHREASMGTAQRGQQLCLVVRVEIPHLKIIFRQISLSFTISRSLLKLMSIESVMPFNHLILCHPLLLLPSIFPAEWSSGFPYFIQFKSEFGNKEFMV